MLVRVLAAVSVSGSRLAGNEPSSPETLWHPHTLPDHYVLPLHRSHSRSRSRARFLYDLFRAVAKATGFGEDEACRSKWEDLSGKGYSRTVFHRLCCGKKLLVKIARHAHGKSRLNIRARWVEVAERWRVPQREAGLREVWKCDGSLQRNLAVTAPARACSLSKMSFGLAETRSVLCRSSRRRDSSRRTVVIVHRGAPMPFRASFAASRYPV